MSSLTLVLSGAADLARGRGETALCVRLHAAASGIRERLKMVRPPDVQQSMARELEKARELLGEPHYSSEWQLGFQMADEAVIRLIQSVLPPDPPDG